MSKKILFISPFANLWQPLVAEIERRYNAQTIYMGQLFREEISSKCELGVAIEKELDSGKILDAQKVWLLVEKGFFHRGENQILLDFPRTKEQSEVFAKNIIQGVIDSPIVYIVAGSKKSAYPLFEQKFDLNNLGVSKNVDDLLNSYYGQNGRLEESIALVEKLGLKSQKLDIHSSIGCISSDI